LPYVLFDATYCTARVEHLFVCEVAVVAAGLAAVGHRERLGFDVGDSENEDSCLGLLLLIENPRT